MSKTKKKPYREFPDPHRPQVWGVFDFDGELLKVRILFPDGRALYTTDGIIWHWSCYALRWDSPIGKGCHIYEAEGTAKKMATLGVVWKCTNMEQIIHAMQVWDRKTMKEVEFLHNI